MIETGIVEVIHKAIQREIVDIVEKEAQEAGKRVEIEVRKRTAQIAATILERFTMERIGQKLQITVDFENTKK